MKKLPIAAAISMSLFVAMNAVADTPKHYADFPVTVKGYDGDKTSSVSYGGQIARYVLHNSLKSMAGSGNGEPNEALKAKLMSYYSGDADGRVIVDPASKEGFAVKQEKVEELSGGKNLKGKAYQGLVPGWPGNMTGAEVLEFMLEKASSTAGGYDPVLAYDYGQLFSKTAIGAVFYNQAVDNYLDELLAADKKPNDKPYSDGAAYTGKEHVWDEAFGYFGAPAHALSLDAETTYSIAKLSKDAFAAADANKDGKVDLKSEMTFANAYYAADADKGGKTDYLHTITKAFIDGRQLITDAKGEKLSDAQRGQLIEFTKVIKSNWEKVLAEAAFKYAGSVYADIQKLQDDKASLAQTKTDFRNYAKHWGELKGFALALQMGGKDLGATAVQINRLIGFSPVSLTGDQVTGLDNEGNYVTGKTISMGEYMVNMAKLQTLLKSEFGLKKLANAISDDLSELNAKLEAKSSAEND